ncbi:MAG: hypothetical protein ACPGXW_07830 [Synechococcus sp.]
MKQASKQRNHSHQAKNSTESVSVSPQQTNLLTPTFFNSFSYTNTATRLARKETEATEINKHSPPRRSKQPEAIPDFLADFSQIGIDFKKTSHTQRRTRQITPPPIQFEDRRA